MNLFKKIEKLKKIAVSNTVRGGSVLIITSLLANLLNLIFAVYTGRVLSLENFAVIGLLSSIANFAEIPFSSLSRTISHKTAYELGKNKRVSRNTWGSLTKSAVKPSIIIGLIWFVIVPFLSSSITHVSAAAFSSLAIIWVLGIFQSINSGFISGSHSFKALSILILSEVISKLFFTVLFVVIGLPALAYLAFPISTVVRFALEIITINKIFKKTNDVKASKKVRLPLRFFFASVLNKITAIVYLSGDVFFANYFLSPQDAGRYTILSTAGKLIYFLGSLSNQFVNPIISKSEGARENSSRAFLLLIGSTVLLSGGGFVVFGIFGFLTVPILLGKKALEISSFIPFYALGMLSVSIGNGIVTYNQIKRRYSVVIASFIASLITLIGFTFINDTVSDFNTVIAGGGVIYLVMVLFFHKFGPFISVVFKNNLPIFPKSKDIVGAGDRKILILNWRDTRHSWAGGAEVYAHEIAKRLVEQGNAVTMFCGNDGNSKNTEVIDGVHIIRKGGFYTVYFWAFIYYMVSFRNKFDCIMDTENGIPFFTPLYARIPIFLVIHHIHQDVHQQYVRFPLSYIAKFIEGKMMPFVYRKTKLITISHSSLEQISKIMPQKKEEIIMMHPGINQKIYKTFSKTDFPSFIYLGRLKHYKNIDVAIKAFDRILKLYPDAKLWIVGEGDEDRNLEALVQNLGINNSVTFFGKVDEDKKAELLGSAWVALQPSMVEGWGITVIEANAAGTPVVASRVNGLVDSIQDGQTGILVTPKSVKEFAASMKFLTQNPKTRKIMTKNALVWSEKFSWDETTKKFIRAIENVEKKFVGRFVLGREYEV